MRIIQAHLEHLDRVSKLFDHYRVFYQQPSDLNAARVFLRDRLQNSDSTILMAEEDDQGVGFTQLYPSFSSVSMKPIWILNDLFVDPNYRQRGIAKALMAQAMTVAQQTGAVRIGLSTQVTNSAAQALYESLGYQKDEEFYHYSLSAS